MASRSARSESSWCTSPASAAQIVRHSAHQVQGLAQVSGGVGEIAACQRLPQGGEAGFQVSRSLAQVPGGLGGLPEGGLQGVGIQRQRGEGAAQSRESVSRGIGCAAQPGSQIFQGLPGRLIVRGLDQIAQCRFRLLQSCRQVRMGLVQLLQSLGQGGRIPGHQGAAQGVQSAPEGFQRGFGRLSGVLQPIQRLPEGLALGARKDRLPRSSAGSEPWKCHGADPPIRR